MNIPYLLAILTMVVVDALNSKPSVEVSSDRDEKIEKRQILIWLPMSTKSHYITFKVQWFYDIGVGFISGTVEILISPHFKHTNRYTNKPTHCNVP